MTVFGAFGVGKAVGRLGAFGAEGMDSVAFRGLDSPFSLVKKIVTGNFLPAMEALIGTSKTTLFPTTSPSIASLFAIPRDLPNKYPFVASAPAFTTASTVIKAEVPTIRDLKLVGVAGAAVTFAELRIAGIS